MQPIGFFCRLTLLLNGGHSLDIPAGARVALCELPFSLIQTDTEGGLGGTCILRGCVPKKLLVYGGQFANEFKECEGDG